MQAFAPDRLGQVKEFDEMLADIALQAELYGRYRGYAALRGVELPPFETRHLDHRKLRHAYAVQKADAKRRGIDFLLSYHQWLSIWVESGHLRERGKRHGQYCMARYGDKGAYEEGNVRICTVGENHAEGIEANRAVCSTLTPADVEEVRRRYTPRSPVDGGYALADKFRCCATTISNVVNRKTWADVRMPRVVIPKELRTASLAGVEGGG